MSIPIDKLYHYIESIAKNISGDDVLIYRFSPHGSKKLEDLTPIKEHTYIKFASLPPIFCYDQEPLDYWRYDQDRYPVPSKLINLLDKYQIPQISCNINKCGAGNIYDKSILIHSEKRSADVDLYANNNFIPVYYWSHAIISLDWYRFAQYETLNKNTKKTFLIYNRAWSGTREYRLKFVDLLVQKKINNLCQTTINPIEPELGIHYSNHTYVKNQWRPDHLLEYYIPDKSEALSSSSATYNIEDYNSTDFEVVLETLFDDDRIQLTEKILRPIALGQPFILASTHGSLEYLRSYGFRTFASVVDESYDTIKDPIQRLQSIVSAMEQITHWSESERKEKLALANQIATYNRKHFFSGKFFAQVADELKDNLQVGLRELEESNTSSRFFNRRKNLIKYKEIADYFLTLGSRSEIATVIAKARKYNS